VHFYTWLPATLISTWVTGIGFDAKYLKWTSSQTPLNQITRKSRMTCPPEIVQDMPERFSRCVKTIEFIPIKSLVATG
jgi:hypothetical protein